MQHPLNPLYWLVKALDSNDRWFARMDYQGRHWKKTNTECQTRSTRTPCP